jgi:Cu(I)/Ag(I) efflux system protein CusF
MRVSTYAFAGALMLAATGAHAADMSNMKGMPMSSAPAAKTGKATGVITALDLKAGTVTIQHGPIPGVGWPAMTMTFKAAPRSLLKGLKVDDHVRFSLRVKGQDNTVTAIGKA